MLFLCGVFPAAPRGTMCYTGNCDASGDWCESYNCICDDPGYPDTVPSCGEGIPAANCNIANCFNESCYCLGR